MIVLLVIAELMHVIKLNNCKNHSILSHYQKGGACSAGDSILIFSYVVKHE